MSQKWVRSKAWDARHLTGAWTPVRWVLRLFSEIPFGVGLLVLVAMYGTLASVPVGLIALAPTWAFYGLTLVAAVGVVAVLPGWVSLRVLRRAGVGVGPRFAAGLIGMLALTALAAFLWHRFAWPAMRYDAAEGSGVRFFGSFVDRYSAMQFRRLPFMEMSELEFYSWWPLRVILLLFVASMVVATLRRIEFSFPYIGVITVHSGIVTIALGSIYYAAQKQEGDMILLAGEPGEDGTPRAGPPETGFYDNTETALWVAQAAPAGGPMGGVGDWGRWEGRRLGHVPRYHEYSINALGLKTLPPVLDAAMAGDQGPLSIHAPAAPAGGTGGVDADVRFRIVGYAPYAELSTRLVRAGDVGPAGLAGRAGESIRTVEAYLNLPPDPSAPDTADPTRPRSVWRLAPDSPARRVDVLSAGGTEMLAVEYVKGMSEARWGSLAAPLPRETRHALLVRHPASGFEAVYPVQNGSKVVVGPTGYTLEVEELAAQPPFPIVTKGYQGGRSSVAVVRVQPPAAKAGEAVAPAYQRWVYHRYAEISQDLVDTPNGAMPSRRNADPALEIAYIDASIIQIYFDESTGGAVRALVRLPGGGATITPDVVAAGTVEVSPGFTLRLGERVDDAVRVEFPVPVPEAQRDPKLIGAHAKAAVAVEMSATVNGQPWAATLWVPFSQYLTLGAENFRAVPLPDGRRVRLAFGRVRHEFRPEMRLRLADFEMIPYPHSTPENQIPRDYRSDLIVQRRWSGRHEDVLRRTSLNEPLLERTPFQRREDVPRAVAPVVNAIGWAFGLIAPNQYKFSQAGWDQDGWRESAAAAARGEVARPSARYTILGVGNNPGIYIIAAGAVMMSVGVPWAFYVKPWIMRRRKRLIQEQLKAGTYGGANGKAGAGAAERASAGVQA